MSELLVWLVVILAIVAVFWALVRDSDRRSQRTVKEWERDFAAGQGKMTQFIKAGALGLESVLIDEKRQAIEHREDEKQGMMKTGGKSDDPDRTASEK